MTEEGQSIHYSSATPLNYTPFLVASSVNTGICRRIRVIDSPGGLVTVWARRGRQRRSGEMIIYQLGVSGFTHARWGAVGN